MHKYLLLFIPLAVLILYSFSVIRFHFNPIDDLQIKFLDVGQGDATLITTPDNLRILVDTGKDQKLISKLVNLFGNSDKRIDYIIITHQDADHFQLLIDILDRFEVGTVFMNKSNKENSLVSAVAASIHSSGVSQLSLFSENDFRVGCCVDFDILWPVERGSAYSESDQNHSSIAFILRYGDFGLFAAGDLDSSGELSSINGLDQDFLDEIDVLKVSHHGSDTSTSPQLLQSLSPIFGVVSAGKGNSYGHPHHSVLDMLSNYGVELLSTIQLGDITLESNGSNQIIINYNPLVNY